MVLCSTDPAAITARRASWRYDGEIIGRHFCHATGGGVIVTRTNWRGMMTAHYFRPREVRKVFAAEKITSNHVRSAVRARLATLLLRDAELRRAPHGLQVCNVLAEIVRCDREDVSFVRVVAVPTRARSRSSTSGSAS